MGPHDGAIRVSVRPWGWHAPDLRRARPWHAQGQPARPPCNSGTQAVALFGHPEPTEGLRARLPRPAPNHTTQDLREGAMGQCLFAGREGA
eukprot:5386256-Alexandrium_andersonii.AAC.1